MDALGATSRGFEVRGALDIGSSQHKLVVARVRWTSGALSGPASAAAATTASLEVVEILRETQIAVYLNDAFVAADSAELSEAILSESESALRTLVKQARTDGAAQIAGVATAVFRKAANGESYLSRISDALQITIRLVTQQMEGELGFMSALAQMQLCCRQVSASLPSKRPELSSVSARSLVSWDSGGGSFQLAAAHPSEYGQDGVPNVLVFQGPIGNANVLALLSEVRGRIFLPGETCNPVSEHEFTKLTQSIARVIASVQVPSWLRARLDQPDCHVVGIGNRTSLFCVGRDATSKQIYTAEDVRESSRALLGKDDDALDRHMRTYAVNLVPRAETDLEWSLASNTLAANDATSSPIVLAAKARAALVGPSRIASYPEPKTVVCKLALLYTVMTQLRIRSVCYQETMGSCPGILLDDSFWTCLKPSAASVDGALPPLVRDLQST